MLVPGFSTTPACTSICHTFSSFSCTKKKKEITHERKGKQKKKKDENEKKERKKVKKKEGKEKLGRELQHLQSFSSSSFPYKEKVKIYLNK
jgi:hypothetical protein